MLATVCKVHFGCSKVTTFKHTHVLPRAIIVELFVRDLNVIKKDQPNTQVVSPPPFEKALI